MLWDKLINFIKRLNFYQSFLPVFGLRSSPNWHLSPPSDPMNAASCKRPGHWRQKCINSSRFDMNGSIRRKTYLKLKGPHVSWSGPS